MFSLFIQLYIAKVPIGCGSGYGENFPDPTGSATLHERSSLSLTLNGKVA